MTKKYHPGQIFNFDDEIGLILSLKEVLSRYYDTKSLVINKNGNQYLQIDFYPEYDKIII